MDQIRENIDAICRIVVQHYGIYAQLDKAQEECGELVAAIAHFRSMREGSEEDLCEELADVIIMATQLKCAINYQLVEQKIQEKLKRTKSLIRKDRDKAGKKTAQLGKPNYGISSKSM